MCRISTSPDMPYQETHELVREESRSTVMHVVIFIVTKAGNDGNRSAMMVQVWHGKPGPRSSARGYTH